VGTCKKNEEAPEGRHKVLEVFLPGAPLALRFRPGQSGLVLPIRLPGTCPSARTARLGNRAGLFSAVPGKAGTRISGAGRFVRDWCRVYGARVFLPRFFARSKDAKGWRGEGQQESDTLPTMSWCQKFAVIVLLLTSVSAWPRQAGSGGKCLQYEPVVVKLTGSLIRRTFLGPPNYESVRKGDRAETSWFLDLPRPVCVDEDKDKAQADINSARSNVGRIQLVVSQEDYKRYRALMHKRVVATGTLFGEITGHHHTPVLLKLTTLARAD
jgi:hypothetical protein